MIGLSWRALKESCELEVIAPKNWEGFFGCVPISCLLKQRERSKLVNSARKKATLTPPPLPPLYTPPTPQSMSYPAALFTLPSLLTNSDSRPPVDAAWAHCRFPHRDFSYLLPRSNVVYVPSGSTDYLTSCRSLHGFRKRNLPKLPQREFDVAVTLPGEPWAGREERMGANRSDGRWWLLSRRRGDETGSRSGLKSSQYSSSEGVTKGTPVHYILGTRRFGTS